MIRLGTVFSGIGSIEQALRRMNIPHSIVFACDNGDAELKLFDKVKQKEYQLLKTKVGKRTLTEDDHVRLIQLEKEEAEIVSSFRDAVYSESDAQKKKHMVDELYRLHTSKKNFVKQTYTANYDISEDDYHLDIRFLDGKVYDGKIDLLVGGSPCQSFSSVGAQRGLEDTRGTLFYEFARIVKDSRPKVFIYENVRGLTTHDEGRTWETIKSVFKNDLHYKISDPKVLNASDYGIPQTRRRLFVVGIREDIQSAPFVYPTPVELKYTMQDFLEENCADGCFSVDERGSICIEKKPGRPNPRFTLTPKVRDYVLASGTKTFKTSTKTDLPIARTLVKTMTQHHRAGVDNYITVSGVGTNRTLRALSDRECLRLMGYPDDFKIVVSPMQIYRQAGNSIVVDVMMALVKQLIQTKVFD